MASLAATASSSTALAIYEVPTAATPMHLPERRYDLGSGEVVVAQRWGAAGTGAAQWHAGVMLARLVDREGPDIWRGLRVLETGAGGGALVAIAALRAGADYVATDADANVFGLLEENLARNVGDLSKYRGTAQLRWGDDVAGAVAALGGPPDVVLAADVIFPGTRDAWPDFFECLKALGARRTLLAYTIRYVKDDALFFRGLRKAGLTAVRLEADGASSSIYEIALPAA